MIPNVLSIAGSDPSGGAGIQADLKVFSALGVYGMAVITALTAQSTVSVTGVRPVPAEWVAAQIDSLASDVRIDAVKIGMLGDAGVVEAVAAALERHRWSCVVLDPVMVSKSGHRLLAPEAVEAVRSRLIPLVDLVTPNLPEAADLLGRAGGEDEDEAGMEEQARRLLDGGARRILLKGGHLAATAESVDVLLQPGAAPVRLRAPRVATRNDHGTGCALSSAITALMARQRLDQPRAQPRARPRAQMSDERDQWRTAVEGAKAYLTGALRESSRLEVGSGEGHGPVHHFWDVWGDTNRHEPTCLGEPAPTGVGKLP